ncbi:4'-phosphopantetheinyl transferase superfamily protein [Streptomyces sp. NBC_01537]|uniref:4'-phosphopantetheinyl transferase family protein n=1 Tax=Streptomyces sp. NBC_01537 TaxID=2903896 RepID=UPI00386F1E57
MSTSPAVNLPAELNLELREGELNVAAHRRAANSASVWIANAEQQGETACRLASGILDASEQQKAAAIRQEPNRVSYVVAHVALRLLLGSFLDIPAAAVRFTREDCPKCGSPHGRPATEGGGVHFSLSHSGSISLLALADSPVGIDVEKIPQLDTAREVGARLHPAEQAELAAASDDAKPLVFARTWARKEAYLKGIGIGLARDFSLDHVGAGPAPASAPRGWRLRDVPVPAGYAGAVAERRPSPKAA